MYKTEPKGTLETAVTDEQLADWIGVDSDDPLLTAVGIAATSAVVEFLGSELVTRSRKVTFETWPTIGTDTSPSISRNNIFLCGNVTLPYARLDTVTEIKAGGSDVDADDYRILDGFPTRLQFDTLPAIFDTDEPALEVTYTAGYGDLDDIPETIRTAVLMVADWLFSNRGSCGAAGAVEKSGAAMLLTPFKAAAVLI